MSTKQFTGDHWAYFGDGNAAQILDSREYLRKRDGKRFVKFILHPSKRIEQIYDISEEQDQTGAIVREYPVSEVVFLERGVMRTRCWIYTDFSGGPTPASRRFKELTEALDDTERLLRSAEAAKNRAYQELEMERQQKKQSLRLQADMVREVARARGRVEGDSDSGIEMDIPEG
jgi:hypothetical protein